MLAASRRRFIKATGTLLSEWLGLRVKQASWSPVAGWIDNVWTQNSKQILDSVGQGE